MSVKFSLSNSSGAILMVSLWILIILTLFALALGRIASFELKLAEYQRDGLKAKQLAHAAIERAIWEKLNDANLNVDALNENWSNYLLSDEPVFKDVELGEGTFSLSYAFDGITLYGMEDEQSKLNPNKLDDPAILTRLLESCEVDHADVLANSILVWCGKITVSAEDANYSDLPYISKKKPAQSVSELLLVAGMTPEILYGEDKDNNGQISTEEQGIAQYLTVYGDGKVNINTASEKVLRALTNDDLTLVGEIIQYRRGADSAIGTEDDNWFADLTFDGQWSALQPLSTSGKLSIKSSTYTIHTQAQVKKVKKSISATIQIDRTKPNPIEYLYWHLN